MQGIMQRGITLPVAEWRLLAAHDACGNLIRALVFATANGQSFTDPDWPLHTDIAIATALMLPPDRVARWKDGPGAPFNQWQQPAALNLIGLRVEPADLFLHLEACGWIRGRGGRADGVIRGHTRTFAELKITATIEYEPGVPTRFGGRWHEQTIRDYRFFRQSNGLEIARSEVHTIAVASVMADLAALQKS